MSELQRIRDDYDLDIGGEFLSADTPSEYTEQFPETCRELFAPGLDTTALDALVTSAMSHHERYSTGMDMAMAISLHRALPLSRRQASDKGFWSWLGVVHSPDLVAWRWAPNVNTGLRSKERFSGSPVRQAFARLWWAAELTRDGDDYTLTAELLNLPGFQDTYEAIFGRSFAYYRPAMGAFISVVDGKSEKQIRKLAKELGYALTTTVLETTAEPELKLLMIVILKNIEEAS
jgi:hypothetical protein